MTEKPIFKDPRAKNEQERVDWLWQLRTNALTVPNLELVEQCEKTIETIVNLVSSVGGY